MFSLLFVGEKRYYYEEFLFITKQTIEAEERGELISRTIISGWGHPIRTLTYLILKVALASSEHG